MAGLKKELLEALLLTKSSLALTCAKACLTSGWDIRCPSPPLSKLSATAWTKQFIFPYLEALATFSGRVKQASHALQD